MRKKMEREEIRACPMVGVLSFLETGNSQLALGRDTATSLGTLCVDY